MLITAAAVPILNHTIDSTWWTKKE